MRIRRIALLVGLYLALDFAVPTLPGAVQLIDGSLEAVDGCRARTVEVPAQAVALLPRHLMTIAFRPEPRPPVECAVVPSRPSLVLLRSPFEPRSRTAPSSSDDD